MRAFEHAIRWNAGSIGNDHAIARGELDRTDAQQRSVSLDAIGEHRRQSRQRVGQVAGAMAGAHFEVAADAQEEHEHADRLEPDVGTPGDDLDDASGVDERDGQRHRHVHAEPSRREKSFRAGEERRRGIEHDGRRREQRQPPENVARRDIDAVECAEPQRAGVHHRLHRAEAGDGEALLRIARFAAAGVVERRAVERQRPIADSCERIDDSR